jgi:diguanylate cyclase (GGDEF)-like protein
VVALRFCNLDNFKSVNDTEGHFAGDRALTGVACCLLEQAEATDVVCRWGGDEFGVIAARRSVADIVDLANRMVAGVRALANAAAAGDPVRRLGISVGVAAFDRAISPHDVVLAADAALYRSKAHETERVHVEMP